MKVECGENHYQIQVGDELDLREYVAAMDSIFFSMKGGV